jgi:hypothetical protein
MAVYDATPRFKTVTSKMRPRASMKPSSDAAS